MFSTPKKKEEKTQEPIETIIGPQLGSDSTYTDRGKSDARRISKITGIEAIAYSWFLAQPSYQGGDWSRIFVDNMLNLKMSEDGWRASQIIKLVAGSKGVPSIDVTKKPGWIGRHFTNKDWKQKAEAEGKDIVE
jgi:hypothetical protein